MQKKRLAVVTATRAEYGLLRRVIETLLKSDKILPEVIVTGAHLSHLYGNTVEEIEKDGIPIAHRLDILKFGSGRVETAQTVAFTIQKFTELFASNPPDGCLVLGDRYEIFAVGAATAMLQIPLVHISGGDVTLGAADEWFRHCLTKMAKLHFPSCEEYAQRVIHMGEQPQWVFNVGGLGDENIRKLPRMPLKELSDSIGFPLKEKGFGLVTFHPETVPSASPLEQMEELLWAMEQLPQLQWVITKANADAGGQEINQRIDEWCAGRTNAKAFTSLGVVRYLSAMKQAAVVVGNSSSGVVETPTFGIPTVNIGDRQRGRILCDNVLCCPPEGQAILQKIQMALSAEFAQKAAATQSPYNGGDTAKKICAILEEKMFCKEFTQPKEFYDVREQ